MFDNRQEEERKMQENVSGQKKKRIRIRPVLLAVALTGYTVFTLLDAFVIPRDIVTLESVQAAAAGERTTDMQTADEKTADGNDPAETGKDEDTNQAGTATENDDSLTENDADNNAAGSENIGAVDSGEQSGEKHKRKPGGKGNGSGGPDFGKGKRGKKKSSSSAGDSSDTQKADEGQSGSGSGGSSGNASGEASTAAVVTSDSYQADGVSITLTEERVYDTEVYIADIQLDNPSQLLSGLADNSFGRNLSQKTSEMASALDAVLAINGDYYGFRDTGYVMRNGYLYRSTARSGSGNEDLVIYEDGTMEIIDESEVTADELVKKGAVQIYSFGPGLVSNGKVTVTEGDEVDQSMSSNPRTAIGMVEPGHYVMVVSDGRTDESAGLSLAQLAEVMQNAGCTTAYNLDGGGSTTMWFNGEIVNNPTGGRGSNERAVSDIVYIGK